MSETPSETCWMCRAQPVPAHIGTMPASLCLKCNETSRPYDEAWRTLSQRLQQNWRDVVKRGSFDLSKMFAAKAPATALNVHLHFVKLLGSKIAIDKINVALAGFAAALIDGQPHPEVTLLVANCETERGKLVYYESDVSVLKRDDEVYSAVWIDMNYPIAVKVCYLKTSAPVSEPEGFPWHPTRQRKLVKLSPYRGDTRPLHVRRDLRM